jgi:hypothetical protein
MIKSKIKQELIKIKRTRLVSSMMAATSIALILILFSTSVSATAITRPISDFTDTNNNISAWGDPDSGLTIFPQGWYVFGYPDAPQSIADCIHSGTVVEKALKDGSIMYKVDLHVKGAMMVVANNTPDNPDIPNVLVVGEMDYHFQATFILYKGELGDLVPNLLQIWFPQFFLPAGAEPIGEGIFSHLTGKGTGTFSSAAAAYYFGFNPDDVVKVKVSQVGIIKPVDHPSYDGVDLNMWPVEIVFFH